MASVAESIANAIVGVLEAISWSPAPPKPFQVVQRKTLTAADGEDCLIVVAQGDGEEYEPHSKGKTFVKYQFGIAFGVRSSAKLGDTAAVRSWRQQAKRAFPGPTLDDVPEVNLIMHRGRPPFDKIAQDKGFAWSSMVLTIETIESTT